MKKHSESAIAFANDLLSHGPQFVNEKNCAMLFDKHVGKYSAQGLHSDNKGAITINSMGQDVVLELGYQTVILDKLFGPTIFADLRIRADITNGGSEWIIERKRIDTGKWIEQCRIPGQLDEEFKDVEP